jgi:hypothetical protein
MKYIFEEFVETKEVYSLIDAQNPTLEDREYMVTIVKDTIYHKLIDLVLDELGDDQKVEFLSKLENENNHTYLLSKLSTWIKDFELKIVERTKLAENEIVQLLKTPIL